MLYELDMMILYRYVFDILLLMGSSYVVFKCWMHRLNPVNGKTNEIPMPLSVRKRLGLI